MRILAIESSAGPASVALVEDGRVTAQYFQNTGFTHSKTLLPMTDAVLTNAGIKAKDIDLFAVANGPGSFTGIRIGVSTVKGMAFAVDKPCVGVSTLEAMAWNLCFTDRTICALMDARVHQVYNALFRVGENKKIERLCPDRAVSVQTLSQALSQAGGNYILVGDGAKLCYNELLEKEIDVILPPENLVFQNAFGVALAAGQGKEFLDASALMPVYLRAPQAERERMKKLEGGQK